VEKTSVAVGTQVEDKYLLVDGLRLHYREWGDEESAPLVLLHGITSNAQTWNRFAPQMADRFRVLAIDQRGHGESDWAPAYSTKLMSDDLESFADALGLAKFALVGHSMGGCNAYYFAAEHPERVTCLVIGDFGPDVVGSSSGNQVAARIVAAASASFASPEEAIEPALALNVRAAEVDVRERVLANLRQREDGRWVWRYDAAGLAGHGPVDRMPAQDQQWRLLERIECPTLIVRGAETDILRLETAERMAKVIGNSSLVEVPNAGHSIPLENPRGWLDAIRPFLVDCPSGN
jgi:pimeloyl-ACP methyl ester carboxylesterase